MGRYLHYSEDDVLAMSPAQSGALRRAGEKHLDEERKFQIAMMVGLVRGIAGVR